jgi:acyl carrier protein
VDRPTAGTSPSSSDSEPGWSTPAKSSASPEPHVHHEKNTHRLRAHSPRITTRRGTIIMADKDQILADMADIVNDITGVDQSEVTLEKFFVDDLDVDSLSMVEIIYACDEKFGVEIPDEESKNIKTVGDAVNYIIEHQG